MRDLFPQECVRWPSTMQWNVNALIRPCTVATTYQTLSRLLSKPGQMWHLLAWARRQNTAVIQYASRFPLGLTQWHPNHHCRPQESKETDRQVTGTTQYWTPPTFISGPHIQKCLQLFVLRSSHTSHRDTVCFDRMTLSVQVYQSADRFNADTWRC